MGCQWNGEGKGRECDMIPLFGCLGHVAVQKLRERPWLSSAQLRSALSLKQRIMAEPTNPSQNPGGNKTSISTAATGTVNAAAGRARGTQRSSHGGRRHRSERFKPRLKNPVVPTSLLVKPPNMSGLNTATVSAEKVDGDGGDHKRMREDGLASTVLAVEKKPGYGAVAGGGSGTAQASRSVPHSESASAGATGDCEGAISIAELWNQAYEQLREIDPKLIKKYEDEISLHVSTMVGTTVAISGLGKVRRREQMELLVKQKLNEDEDGKWRIPLGHDRIAIRDLAGYVVSIVDWGKEFVGKALESSPYGSLAWAGVCLLLPVSTFSVVWGLTWCASSRTLFLVRRSMKT